MQVTMFRSVKPGSQLQRSSSPNRESCSYSVPVRYPGRRLFGGEM